MAELCAHLRAELKFPQEAGVRIACHACGLFLIVRHRSVTLHRLGSDPAAVLARLPYAPRAVPPPRRDRRYP